MMTGRRGQVRMPARVPIPSSTGISTSSRTRSGASWGIRSSAARPSAAEPTTSIRSSPARASATTFRTTRASSTISTRTRPPADSAMPVTAGRDGREVMAQRTTGPVASQTRPACAGPTTTTLAAGRPPGRVAIPSLAATGYFSFCQMYHVRSRTPEPGKSRHPLLHQPDHGVPLDHQRPPQGAPASERPLPGLRSRSRLVLPVLEPAGNWRP